MPQDHGQVWEAVEKPGKDQPQRVLGGIHGPAPDGAVQFRMILKALRKLKGRSGVQVQRDVQLRDALPKHQEAVFVQIMPVGWTADQRSQKTVLAHRARQLIGGRLGILKSQMREPAVAIGMLADLRCQKVIGLASMGNGGGGAALGLDSRSSDRQDRNIDARLVHGFEAQAVEIGQPGHQARHRFLVEADGERAEGIGQRSCRVMLFQRNSLHIVLSGA